MKVILAVLIEAFCFVGIIYFYVQQEKKKKAGEDQLLVTLEERKAKEAAEKNLEDIDELILLDEMLEDEAEEDILSGSEDEAIY